MHKIYCSVPQHLFSTLCFTMPIIGWSVVDLINRRRSWMDGWRTQNENFKYGGDRWWWCVPSSSFTSSRIISSSWNSTSSVVTGWDTYILQPENFFPLGFGASLSFLWDESFKQNLHFMLRTSHQIKFQWSSVQLSQHLLFLSAPQQLND